MRSLLSAPQLLKAETDALELLVSAAFPEPEGSPQHLAPHRRLRSHHERWLCLQIRSAAASIQVRPLPELWGPAAGRHRTAPAAGGGALAPRRRCPTAPLRCQLFAGDVLKLFSTDCKRMSAEIFDQTMPLGRHWRLGLRAGGWRPPVPSIPPPPSRPGPRR